MMQRFAAKARGKKHRPAAPNSRDSDDDDGDDTRSSQTASQRRGDGDETQDSLNAPRETASASSVYTQHCPASLPRRRPPLPTLQRASLSPRPSDDTQQQLTEFDPEAIASLLLCRSSILESSRNRRPERHISKQTP